MSDAATTVERDGPTAVVRVRGDLVIPTVGRLHGTLRGLQKRRDVRKVVIDFSDAGRLDSAGVAVVELARRALVRSGKELEIERLGESQRAAFDLAPTRGKQPAPPERPTRLEDLGERVLQVLDTARAVAKLTGGVLRESVDVARGRQRLPRQSVLIQIVTMGADGVFIVALLSFLLGLTIAFQGAVQLTRFGAGAFVADMVGWTMIRELSPLMTAIMLSGRTGAAIAAELGTMRVGQEIDALMSMGVSPTRFLVVPRLAALTLALPALTLISMFVAIAGGMLVTWFLLDMAPATFWFRVVEFVTMTDFLHGFLKSFAFAWIIGISASHLGMSAQGDASSVGAATTRTVVVSIFFIIVVDAAWATAISLWSQTS